MAVAIKGYTLLETLHQSSSFVVQRAVRDQDRVPVVLKSLNGSNVSSDGVMRFLNEHRLMQQLDGAGSVRVFDLIKEEHILSIVMEDIGADAISSLLRQEVAIPRFLEIAILCVKALGEIHRHHIIHKNIHPGNIIYNPEINVLKFIDFGLSTELPHERFNVTVGDLSEASLPHISPEHSGRTNRVLDYRSDYYSLGMTFYQLITQNLPFHANSAIEWIQFHIAKAPRSPRSIRPEIPETLAEIILKLLAKDVEDRYRSIDALQEDLERCSQEYRETGQISSFQIGFRDIASTLQISQKLYGRDDQTAILENAFARIEKGAVELLLVTGESGLGKTSLVNELRKTVTGSEGYFAKGKFERYESDRPYSAFVQALTDIIHQFLTEPEQRLIRWQDDLMEAAGSNGQLLIDLVPDLEKIIGKPPPLQNLGEKERHNRFLYTLGSFMQVLARKENPLVLFLDDLQWADPSTLYLMDHLLRAPDISHILLIGTCNEKALPVDHPLNVFLDNIKSVLPPKYVHLQPLEIDTTGRLISDSLDCAPSDCRQLARFIQGKTYGNPLYIHRFLNALPEKKLLWFVEDKWHWDLEAIAGLDVSPNVLEFLQSRMNELDPEVIELLKICACIGDRFNQDLLSRVMTKSLDYTSSILWRALVEDIIVPVDARYRFLLNPVEDKGKIPAHFLKIELKFHHDRVKAALYESIPEQQRKKNHFLIGMILRDHDCREDEKNLLETTHHLNEARELIKNKRDRRDLARLNLLVGRKSRSTSAYEAAKHYFVIGIGLLEEKSWDTHYELTLELYNEACEVSVHTSEFSHVEDYAAAVLKHARTLGDQLKVYMARIQASFARNRFLEATEEGKKVLRFLGYRFPKRPALRHWVSGLLKTEWFLRLNKNKEISNLPEMTNKRALAAMRFLSGIGSSALMGYPELLPLLVFRSVQLTLQYGIAPESALGFAGYGMISCSALKKVENGNDFGDLALQLNQRPECTQLKTSTRFIVADMIRTWKYHLREIIPQFEKIYHEGLENGEIEFGLFSTVSYVTCNYYLGLQPLPELSIRAFHYRKALQHFKLEAILNFLNINHQSILNLMGQAENPKLLAGEVYDETEMLPVHIGSNDTLSVCYVLINKAILNFLFEDYEQAAQLSREVSPYLRQSTETFRNTFFYMYSSLSYLALLRENPEIVNRKRKKQLLSMIAENQKRLKEWSRHAPENNLHKWYLVEAERAFYFGRMKTACNYYKQSLQYAKKHQYRAEEAVINYLFAKYWLKQHDEKNAKMYMAESRFSFNLWGATAVVKHQEESYPHLRE